MRAEPGQGEGGKESLGDRAKGWQERGKGRFWEGALTWQVEIRGHDQ